MRMEPEEIRKFVKRAAIISSFFLLALLFYILGSNGAPVWRSVLLVYALLVTAVLVLAILVQSGRGGGLAGLGGAGGESFLGARAATPIAKATYILGALLLFICMLMARMGHHTERPQLRSRRETRLPAAESASAVDELDTDTVSQGGD